MARCGRRLLILVALCLHGRMYSNGHERGTHSDTNSAFSQQNNLTSSFLNVIGRTKLRTISELGVNDGSILEFYRTTKKIRKERSTRKLTKPENFTSKISHAIASESKTMSTSSFPFLFTESSNLAKRSSPLENTVGIQSTQGDSLFEGKGAKQQTICPEPPGQKSDFVTYCVSVGEDCTKSLSRSGTPSAVTHCSMDSLLKSDPWTNKLSGFQSLSLTTSDMGLCYSSKDTGHLQVNYILNGTIAISTGDDMFQTNKSLEEKDLCLHLQSPPGTIIQMTLTGMDDKINYFNGTRFELKPGQHEQIATLTKGRVLQSDGNNAFIIVHDLISKFQNSSDSLTLRLIFQVVPWCMKEQLEVKCPLEKKTGYIQTPHWDGLTPYNSQMNSCLTITAPVDTVIMVSFALLNIQKCDGCSCDSLSLYLSPACAGSPVATLCGSQDVPPALYQTSVMSLCFESNRRTQPAGFRLLYSFHSSANPPRKLASEKWVCSGASGPVLVQHFICSPHIFCHNAEDRVPGCFPRDICGEASFHFQGKCYLYFNPQTAVDMDDVLRTCEENKGVAVSLNTKEEWEKVAEFWSKMPLARELLVAMWTFYRSHTDLYSSLLLWADNTIAYYMDIRDSSSRSPKKCAYLQPLRLHLVIDSCFSVLRPSFLCELESERNQSIESGQRSKILLTVPSRTPSAFPHLTTCPNKQATHSFLQCDQNSFCYGRKEEKEDCFQENPSVGETMFRCKDGKQDVHYTLVCDRRNDCADKSDEDFCTLAFCPSTHFSCRTTKECLPPTLHCDFIKDCADGSDEENCAISIQSNTIPPPAIITFTGSGSLTVTPVNTSLGDPVCPETHFQCPGDGYCLPVYVRCNQILDCPGGEDEADCESYTCPGFYRCFGRRNCLHADHVCDGIFQCHNHDDELMCNTTCPHHCVCTGFAFTCKNKFSAKLYFQLRYLNVDNTGMNLQDVTHNHMLIYLSLRHCGIKEIGKVDLPNLQSLNLSYNALTSVTGLELQGMKSLRFLSLSFNKILSFNFFDFANKTFTDIMFLDMSGTGTREISETLFWSFPGLVYLNLSESKLQKIQKPGFSAFPKLKSIDLSECKITEFYGQMFKGLSNLETIHASKFQMCCPSVLPENFCTDNCFYPSLSVSSCNALLRADVFRAFLVLYAFLALVGNFYSFVYRVFGKGVTTKLGFDIFVTHLCVSDFLMGMYLAIVGIADRVYYGTYEWNDLKWKQSVACQIAGFLSLLSSEVSAFLICFITLERFLLIRFPHRQLRFTAKSAQTACILGWMVGFLLAAIPLFPFSPPWDFYGQTGICIPLPITTKEFAGSEYSFYLMIVFNFILFILIAAGQFLIFWSIRSQRKMMGGSSKKAKDMAIARRLLAVVMSDFLCWFPIGLLGLLAKSGVPISGDANVAMAIFVLPFNSALNPFLYTFQMLLERRRVARSGNKGRGEITSESRGTCDRCEQALSPDTPSLSAAQQPVNSLAVSADGDSEQKLLNLVEKNINQILDKKWMTSGRLFGFLNQIIEDRELLDAAD